MTPCSNRVPYTEAANKQNKFTSERSQVPSFYTAFVEWFRKQNVSSLKKQALLQEKKNTKLITAAKLQQSVFTFDQY